MIFISKPCVNYCGSQGQNEEHQPRAAHPNPRQSPGGTKQEGVLLPWESGEEDVQHLIYEITSKLPQ